MESAAASALQHLDERIRACRVLADPEGMPTVAADAYLGYRAITPLCRRQLSQPWAFIAEIMQNVECVVTQVEQLGGFVTMGTIKCQLLYELQGKHPPQQRRQSKYPAKLTLPASPRTASIVGGGVGALPPAATTKLEILQRRLPV